MKRRSRAREERKLFEHWHAFQGKVQHENRGRGYSQKTGSIIRILRGHTTKKGTVHTTESACISRQFGTDFKAHLLL
jgi:hypothetical protein